MTVITNRFMESKILHKKNTEFIETQLNVTEKAKKQAIEGLMEIYKFQHSIQIIRWVGQTHYDYDQDAW